MARNFISEDDIEQALLQKLQHRHGFDVQNCHTVNPDDLNDGSQRTDKRDVILAERLHAACERLNPHIPITVIAEVVAMLMDHRPALSPLKANQELDQFIRDGVPVTFEDAKGVKQHDTVRLIDFNTPTNNRYLAVAQLWIKSWGQAPKAAYRRPDVILYVNGLPLVFIELKNSTVKLRSAFDDNQRKR